MYCIPCVRQSLLLAVVTVMAGCHSFGPDGLRATHPLYNEAIVGSMNEQFVQNIVRLHYRDTIFFLDVASVTASLKLDMSAGLDQSEVGFGPAGGTDLMKYSLGTAYTTAPTLSYAPLQGEGFVKSILSPIPLEALFTLTGSGWRSHRLFGLCVERINGLENAPIASGPTPNFPPDQDRQFNRLLQLFEQVVNDELIVPRIDPATKEPQLQIKSSPEHREAIWEIKQLLGLDQKLDVYRVSSNFLQLRPDTVSIRTRPLMSIFFYISQHVDSPKTHKEKGLVTVTRNRDGSEFDWGTTAGGRIFHIRQSEGRPDGAFVAIPYRDHWFYLADNDLESKSTFMLLTQLFRLQAGAAKTTGPALTIPVR
ncbi:MAG: hypothetical protein NTX45_07130 [Proteobacteria bacterium]|nr:hypothetical protein [Pseudomonadota bacterium]